MRVFESLRAAAAILLGAALMSRAALVLVNNFDGLYGQDAYAYYDYGRALFDALKHFHAPPPFWWPLGYPAVLNFAFVVGGVSIASAQWVTILCGALVAPLTFGLAYEITPASYRNVAAWVAGLICAVDGQLAQSSVVIMADAPALMFATLAAWLLVRYARTRYVLTLCLASIAAGIAVWTRWQNLIFAIFWILALLLIEIGSVTRFTPNSESTETGSWRVGRSRIFIAFALLAFVLLPQLLIRNATNSPLAGQSWLEGWSFSNFFARTFENVDGHFEYALPVAIFYAQVFAHPAYLFVMFTPFFLIGAIILLREFRPVHQTIPQLDVTLSSKNPFSRPDSWSKPVLLLGWIAGMVLFLAGIPYENFRFGLGVFAPLAAVTGIGAGWVWQRWRASHFRSLFVGWIVVALVVMLVWQPRVLAPVLAIKTRELAQVRWLESQLLPDAHLYTMSIDGAVQTYSKIGVTNLWEMDPTALDFSVPIFLYVDLNNIKTQWRGRLPDQLLRGLNETGFLHLEGMFADWTLYRARDCAHHVVDCE